MKRLIAALCVVSSSVALADAPVPCEDAVLVDALAKVAALTAPGGAEGRAAAEARNPLGLRAVKQSVSFTFASAEEAARAKVRVAPLSGNAAFAFTSRWDDSNWKHIERAKVFQSVGWNATFFLNGDAKFMKEAAPKLLEVGSRVGNHTTNHPFLMQSPANVVWTEVLENRINIEANAQSVVTSFVIPYNWGSPMEPERQGKLVRMLVETGHIVSSDWKIDGVDEPAWMPGHTFNGNDSKPETGKFASNLVAQSYGVAHNPALPKITFGIHSWCDDKGLALQGTWLAAVKKSLANAWFTDDSRYGAYRYTFANGEVAAAVDAANPCVVNVSLDRFDASEFGVEEPLSLIVEDAEPVAASVQRGERGTWSVPAPALVGMRSPVRFERIDGEGASALVADRAFAIQVDTSAGDAATVSVTGLEGLAGVRAVVFAPPLYGARRANADAAGKAVFARVDDDPEARYGTHLWAASIDYENADGEPCRTWLVRKIAGAKIPKGAGDLPRDTCLVLGPVPRDAYGDSARWEAVSNADVELSSFGLRPWENWRSMADLSRAGFVAAAYIPWAPGVAADFKAAVGDLCGKTNALFIAAMDIIADAECDATLHLNRDKWQTQELWINGEHKAGKGGYWTLHLNAGRNRLLLNWEWFMHWTPQALQLKLAAPCATRFAMPKVELGKNVYESDGGFSLQFNEHGQPVDVRYGDAPVFNALFVGLGGSLSKEKGSGAPEPVFTRGTDVDGKPTLFCEVDAPRGTAMARVAYHFSYTVSEKALHAEGWIEPDADAPWTDSMFQTDAHMPLELFKGREWTTTHVNGTVRTEPFVSDAYSPKNDRGDIQTLSAGAFHLECGEGTRMMNIFDRRQWNNQALNAKIIVPGSRVWGEPKPTARRFAWNWTARFE